MNPTATPENISSHPNRFRQYTSLLSKYLSQQRLSVVALAVLLSGSITLQLVNPQVIRYFLDTARTGGALRLLILAALAYIGFALFQQGLSVLAAYLSKDVSWIATNHLRQDLLLHCLRLDMSFHKQRTPGELIERIDGDASELASFFSDFAIRLGGNALLIAGILALLFREDVRLGLGLSLYTLLTLFLLSLLQKIAEPRWAAVRQASSQESSFIEERISGAEEVRAAAAEAHTLNRLYMLMRAWLRSLLLAFMTSSLTASLTSLLFALGYTAGLALGVYLYTRGQATLGTAYLVTSYVGMLSGPLQEIRQQAQNLQQASASIRRIQELFAIQPRMAVNEGGKQNDDRSLTPAPLPMGEGENQTHLLAGEGGNQTHLLVGEGENQTHLLAGEGVKQGALGVSFQNVSFRYEDEQTSSSSPDQVLCDVSFQLAPGQVLGILGRTGSGKSTLARLLVRLYDPTQGAIRLNGLDVRQVRLDELRDRVGMVTQDVQLFQASIRDNLTFFHPGPSQDERLLALIQEMGLQEWLQSQPSGLDTRLAGGSSGLSAGQAQLLAFTRLFLKDPGLVILDEASSRLDPATERLLERAIERLLAGRTGIVIAHRLRTVQRADFILILEDGQVIEYGARQALAEDASSRFAALLQTGMEEVLA